MILVDIWVDMLRVWYQVIVLDTLWIIPIENVVVRSVRRIFS